MQQGTWSLPCQEKPTTMVASMCPDCPCVPYPQQNASSLRLTYIRRPAQFKFVSALYLFPFSGHCFTRRIRLPIGTLFHHVLTTHRFLIKTLMLFPKIKLGLAALFYSSITQIAASLTIKRQATTCNGHSEVSSWFFTA